MLYVYIIVTNRQNILLYIYILFFCYIYLVTQDQDDICMGSPATAYLKDIHMGSPPNSILEKLIGRP